jgi:adrenodoxin-NADP+ reductase
MALDNVHFFGNVWLGSEEEAASKNCNHISIEALKNNYSAVILAYGAISDRELGLAGEHTLKGIMPSRRVVDWYNGSLDCDLNIQKEFNLEQIGHLAIIGNGNIACDISRMLLKDVNEFNNSDAPTHVLETLRRSKLNSISMIARRGVTQAAFTTKEIKELC